MEDDFSPLSHGQFFIHSNIKLCQIFCKSKILPQLKRCILVYKDDSTTIGTLLQLLQKQQKAKLTAVKSNQVLNLSIGKVILQKKWTIRQVRSMLHNFLSRILKFDLLVNQRSQLRLQCASSTESLKDHPLYKEITAKENKIQICIELPQLDKEYYHQMNANNPLKFEIDKFLFAKRDQKGWSFKLQQYKVKCQKCKQEIKELTEPTYKHFQYHFTIQINFQSIKNNQSKSNQQTKEKGLQIVIRRSNINHLPILKVAYKDVRKKKVKSILEKCQHFKEFFNSGLRIGEIILKPYQFLSSINELAARNSGEVDAFIVDESQIFYNISHSFGNVNFDLQQVIEASKTCQKKRIYDNIESQRQRATRSQTNSILKSNNFLDPILGYTSQLYYRELNAFLRDTALAWLSKQQLENSYLRWSFALIKSLHHLLNYNGITYRGVQHMIGQFMKKGEIICFKSFISTSESRKKALQSFTKHTFFIIHCLTGKSIGKYSFYPQYEVLIMPYSYFQVLSVDYQNDLFTVELQQIPIPRKKNHNILLWVDDNTLEGYKVYKNLHLRYPMIKTEFIQLLSNDRLKEWIQKFNNLIGNGNKISVITDMKREKYDDGIETIRIVQKYIPKANIMVYISRKQETIKLIESNQLKLSQKLIVGDQKQEVVKYFEQKVLNPEQLQQSDCQLI